MLKDILDNTSMQQNTITLAEASTERELNRHSGGNSIDYHWTWSRLQLNTSTLNILILFIPCNIICFLLLHTINLYIRTHTQKFNSYAFNWFRCCSLNIVVDPQNTQEWCLYISSIYSIYANCWLLTRSTLNLIKVTTQTNNSFGLCAV